MSLRGRGWRAVTTFDCLRYMSAPWCGRRVVFGDDGLPSSGPGPAGEGDAAVACGSGQGEDGEGGDGVVGVDRPEATIDVFNLCVRYVVPDWAGALVGQAFLGADGGEREGRRWRDDGAAVGGDGGAAVVRRERAVALGTYDGDRSTAVGRA